MHLNEEKEIIEKAKKNPEAFGLLYDLYCKKIFGYILRRVGGYEIARDITSETFFKAFQKIHLFRWQGISISSWFYRIATNEVNQFLRKKQYKTYNINEVFGGSTELFTEPFSEETTKEKIENQMKAYKDFELVQQQLKSLPVAYQEIIALKYFEDKSIKEISEIVSKKEGTVKSLLSRGLEKLKKML